MTASPERTIEPTSSSGSTSTATSNGGVATERLLDVRDLRTHFRTARGIVKAVDGVSFTLQKGRTLGLVGESGSGKSVLSRSVMRLLPKRDAITSGEVHYRGRNLAELPEREMRDYWGREIAMVFQDPMTSLNPVIKIGRQITEGLQHHLGMSKPDARATALDLLTDVGIPEPARRLEEYPHQLSGGMRQRVCIAIALACGPQLLFADEATTALDVTVQAQILKLLGRLQRERQMSMVMVTHDLGVVANHSDEIAVMYGGKIVEKAPTAVLFSNMKMPYTEALLRSIPKLENPSHTRLQVIAGRPPNLVNPPKGCTFSPRCPYAQERCHNEQPPLQESGVAGHTFACWYPVGTPENERALELNLRRGHEGARVLVGDTAALAAN